MKAIQLQCLFEKRLCLEAGRSQQPFGIYLVHGRELARLQGASDQSPSLFSPLPAALGEVTAQEQHGSLVRANVLALKRLEGFEELLPAIEDQEQSGLLDGQPELIGMASRDRLV